MSAVYHPRPNSPTRTLIPTLHQQTAYTLSCTALDSSPYQESAAVNLDPAYQEK
jgi:hypothetical protein